VLQSWQNKLWFGKSFVVPFTFPNLGTATLAKGFLTFPAANRFLVERIIISNKVFTKGQIAFFLFRQLFRTAFLLGLALGHSCKLKGL